MDLGKELLILRYSKILSQQLIFKLTGPSNRFERKKFSLVVETSVHNTPLKQSFTNVAGGNLFRIYIHYGEESR